MKNKIVLRPDEFSVFTAYYLEYLWSRYFNICMFDHDVTYDRNTLFVVGWMNFDDQYSRRLRDQGYKVVVDNLWEFPLHRTDYYWLEHNSWFWYNESLLWRSEGYHLYQPKKQYSKLALMPIRRHDTIRDKIVDQLGPRLDHFLYSYKNTLPNDISCLDTRYQRYFNPDWYDQTYFSLVVETSVYPAFQPWVTEKIFKPCAYFHPFMVIGQPGTLAFLKQMGFETYDNLFDESYDSIKNFNARFAAILDNIDNFAAEPYDTETSARLQHNHYHFFDQALVESCIVTEIVEPLIHYAETR